MNKTLNGNRKDIIASGSIVLDGVLVIANIRVVRLQNGKTVVAMPSRQIATGEYKDLVYPISPALRVIIDTAVIAALEAKA